MTVLNPSLQQTLNGGKRNMDGVSVPGEIYNNIKMNGNGFSRATNGSIFNSIAVGGGERRDTTSPARVYDTTADSI